MRKPLIEMTVTTEGNKVSLTAECFDSNLASMMKRLFIVLMKETVKDLAPSKK